MLAIDDDPSVRASLALVLDEHCEVVLAADGAEAIDILASRSVDVVLLDLLMPGMHGHDVLLQIRTTYVRTPVIVLTALADVPSVVASIKLGAWDYVTKPWRDEELLARVHRAVRERPHEPGVLLVSDDPAAVAALEIALQPCARVLATTVTRAIRSRFPAKAIVLASRPASALDEARLLHHHFPDAAFVVIDDRPQMLTRLQELRIPAVVTSGRLDRVLSELLRLGVIQDLVQPSSALATAIQYIATHYGERITVADVADAVRLSEDYLIHVFRKTTGFSVKDYVMRLRMAIARRLLLETGATVEAISDRLGFADVSNFSRSFRAVGGLPPGAFRRAQTRALG